MTSTLNIQDLLRKQRQQIICTSGKTCSTVVVMVDNKKVIETLLLKPNKICLLQAECIFSSVARQRLVIKGRLLTGTNHLLSVTSTSVMKLHSPIKWSSTNPIKRAYIRYQLFGKFGACRIKTFSMNPRVKWNFLEILQEPPH